MKQIRKLDKDRMRQNNVRLIFETIYREQSITRASLAEKTRISAMNVGRIVDVLLAQGLLAEHAPMESGAPGRPGMNLRLRRENILHLGVALDSEGMSAGLVDPYGEIRHRFRHPIDVKAAPAAEVLREVGEAVRRCLLEQGATADTMGMVIPGLLDPNNGVVKVSSQLGWRDVPVAELLRRHAGLPAVLLENDAKARAWAENWCGVSQAFHNSVLVMVGSGIGAGVMIDGDIYRGKSNMAGEIGHVVIHTNTRMCECGQVGCLQATLTEHAIVREARTVCPEIARMDDITEAYLRGEDWARRLTELVCRDVLTTINLLANSFASEAIILCGSLVDNHPLLRTLISEAYQRRQSSFLHTDFALCYSGFGAEGNVIAAAMVALAHMLKTSLDPACARRAAAGGNGGTDRGINRQGQR